MIGINFITTVSNPKIHNLRELVSALKSNSDNEYYSDVLNKIQFGFKDVEHLCFWDRDYHSKISIAKGEGFELVLICWENGQKSPINNHGLNETWTYILKGELTEELYSKTKENSTLESTVLLPQKSLSSLKDESNKTHRLINSFGGRSVSLHLYKK